MNLNMGTSKTSTRQSRRRQNAGSPADISSADVSSGSVADPRRWITLSVLLLAACMDLLDVSIVNVAIPSIQRGVSATYAAVEWVLAGYTLAFAVGLITGGRLGDLYGRKKMFLIGVAWFTAASALCGAAQDPGMLIASRVLQGAAAAVMVPQVLSIIQVTFPERERPAALGAYGAAAGLATISGPLFGGLLIRANLFSLGWRPIFLVNVVIGVLAIAAASVLVRESRAQGATRLDLGGVGLISAALVVLVYPLVQGRDLHWPWWTFLLMAAAVPLLGIFAWYERRLAATGGSPLLPLALFARRSFSAGTALTLSFMLGLGSFYLILTLYLQLGLGYTVLHTGLTTVPSSIGLALAAAVASKPAPRLGRLLLAPGGLLAAVGIAWMIATFHHDGATVTSWQIAPSMFTLGLGMGVVAPSLVDASLANVPHEHAGSASGVVNTMMQLGGAIGVAVIGVLFFGLLGARADYHAAAVAPQLRTEFAAARVAPAEQDILVRGFERCFDARFATTDITATPAACQAPQSDPVVANVIAGASRQATAGNFGSAITGSLWFQVGAFGLTALLLLLLPSRRNTA